MSTGPCKNCPDRKPRCHTVCEKYAAFERQKKEEYKAKHDATEIEAYEIGRGKKFSSWKGRKV